MDVLFPLSDHVSAVDGILKSQNSLCTTRNKISSWGRGRERERGGEKEKGKREGRQKRWLSAEHNHPCRNFFSIESMALTH